MAARARVCYLVPGQSPGPLAHLIMMPQANSVEPVGNGGDSGVASPLEGVN